MASFRVENCFGVDISFGYFDVDELLSVLKIDEAIKKSARIRKLVKEHGLKHKIVLIAKRQMALDEVKSALDGPILPYDPYYYDKRVMASDKDRLYDAQERFLQICLSLSTGRSIRSLKKLKGRFDSRDIRDLATKGKSLFRYFRNILNDHTRDYIMAFKEGRASEGSSRVAASETPSREMSEEDGVSASILSEPAAELEEHESSDVPVKVSGRRGSKTSNRGRQADFGDEIQDANKLLRQGKRLLLEQVKLLKTGAPFEVAKLEDFCDGIIESYGRNPNALMCLRHIRSQETYLVQHLLSSAVLAVHFGRALSLSEPFVKALCLGGLLFDFGRFRLPDALVNKSGKLTPGEFDLFRKHIDFGLHAIRNSEGMVKVIYQMTDDHHEKVDGSGYPAGKQDREISVYGKIAAIIDAYDAMTSDQAHKASMGPLRACRKLRTEAGLAFDADLVDVFVKSMGEVPVGACVELSNGRVGFVLTVNRAKKPSLVRQVFNLRQRAFIAASDIYLDKAAGIGVDVSIVKEADPGELGINLVDHLL